MNELIGHVVNSVRLNDYDTLIVFDTEMGPIAYQMWGDCCSESWISSITGIVNLLGHQVLDVQARPEVANLFSERQEIDILYGYFIATSNPNYYTPTIDNARWCEIEFRNASNGFYGGGCDLWKGNLEDIEGLRVIERDF